MNNVSGLSRNILATAVVIAGLIYFSDILTPLALAIFLWLTIDGLAVFIHSRVPKVPRKLAVPFTLLLVFFSLASVVAFVAQYARSFSKDLSAYHLRLDAVISQVYGMLPLSGPSPTVGELFAKVNPSKILNGVGDALTGFGGEALFVLIYVLCLFAAQASLPRKIVNMIESTEERDKIVAITGAIRRSMEQYLWVQTITGLVIAVACYILFMVLGLKNALFWALMTFLLSYIPALGGVVATALPMIFALVQFPTIAPALLILGVTQAIQFIVGNIIQPRMTGDSLNISILVVFLSLAFWGKIWGGAGMFLAVPISVMVMIIMAQFSSTRGIAIMMSANGNPDVDLKLPRRNGKTKAK